MSKALSILANWTESKELPVTKAYGHTGFATAEAAIENAQSSVLSLFKNDLVFLKHTDQLGNTDYGWVYPSEYAEQLLSENPRIARV